jgi:hypothetical protein
MTTREFLKALGRLKVRWYVTRWGQRIRCRHKSQECCPITALGNSRARSFKFDVDSPWAAGRYLGIPKERATCIIAAADGVSNNRLRDQLLVLVDGKRTSRAHRGTRPD